jgi:hypothetical protein
MCDKCKISVNINVTCNERKERVDSHKNPYAIHCPQCGDMVGMGLPDMIVTTDDCSRCRSK